MRSNFTAEISYEGKSLLAVILPSLKRDGMHYEVNITGYPRFFMKWSASDRYDLVKPKDANVPYGLLLVVSDMIEKRMGR